MNTIKILSFNLSWKTMTGKGYGEICLMTTKEKDLINVCLENVVHFIDENQPYDFVGFQEASNWQIIQSESAVLRGMNSENYVSGPESIVTFWDKSKYRLDHTYNKLVGELTIPGRPILILFFNKNLCVINIHAGHHYSIYQLDKAIILALKDFNSKSGESIEPFVEKFRTYNIILMGDFNSELKSNSDNSNNSNNSTIKFFTNKYFKRYSILSGRTFYGKNQMKSCCDSTLSGKISSMRSAFDHILSTFPDTNSKIYSLKMASDHLPIIGSVNTTNLIVIGGNNMPKILGFDFDGVLHPDVTPPDIQGQRHPVNLNGPFRAFPKMIKKIKSELLKGNKVYIITARSESKSSIQTIKNHLASNDLLELSDNVYYTKGRDKTKIIKNLGINEFYDDSCLRIRELYNSVLNGKLSQLHKIFLVNPNDMNYLQVTGENINHVIIDCSNKIIDHYQQIISQIIMSGQYKFQNNLIREKITELDSLLRNANSADLNKVVELQSQIIRLIYGELIELGILRN